MMSSDDKLEAIVWLCKTAFLLGMIGAAAFTVCYAISHGLIQAK